MSIEIKIDGKAIAIPKELEDQIRGIAPKAGRWKPKLYEKYWLVDHDGNVESSIWIDYDLDDWRYSQRNVFKTEAEAEAHKRHLEAVARLRNTSDFEPDWDSTAENRFVVYYDHGNKKLYEMKLRAGQQYTDLVYYRSRADAEQSINEHKTDWLTVFGVAS